MRKKGNSKCNSQTDGLSHLKNLENLNIYYNNIQTIDELYRLRQNQSLKDIDLRLNPGRYSFVLA